jgi:hypothetical protein
MKVLELHPAKYVRWQVVDGPEEWIGTTVSWEIKQDGDYAIVLLKHQDWREPVKFMHHCSTKWAVFLMSLKSLLETGEGAPYPIDIKIDNWNQSIADDGAEPMVSPALLRTASARL